MRSLELVRACACNIIIFSLATAHIIIDSLPKVVTLDATNTASKKRYRSQKICLLSPRTQYVYSVEPPSARARNAIQMALRWRTNGGPTLVSTGKTFHSVCKRVNSKSVRLEFSLAVNQNFSLWPRVENTIFHARITRA